MSHLSSPQTLCTLSGGQRAVVEAVDMHCPDHCRLCEMGFRPGEMVTMLMPGCPCAVAVGETRLMVRRDLLSSVHVTLLA